jgi:hypothetical protein
LRIDKQNQPTVSRHGKRNVGEEAQQGQRMWEDTIPLFGASNGAIKNQGNMLNFGLRGLLINMCTCNNQPKIRGCAGGSISEVLDIGEEV